MFPVRRVAKNCQSGGRDLNFFYFILLLTGICRMYIFLETNKKVLVTPFKPSQAVNMKPLFIQGWPYILVYILAFLYVITFSF